MFSIAKTSTLVAIVALAGCAQPVTLDTSVPIVVPAGADANLTQDETKMIYAMRQNDCQIVSGADNAAKALLMPLGFNPTTAKSALRTIRDKGFAVDNRDAAGKLISVTLKPEVCA